MMDLAAWITVGGVAAIVFASAVYWLQYSAVVAPIEVERLVPPDSRPEPAVTETGTTLSDGVTAVTGTTSGEGVTVVTGTTSVEGVTVVTGTTSVEGVTVVTGTTSDEGVTVVTGTTSDEGVTVVTGTTSGEGEVVVIDSPLTRKSEPDARVTIRGHFFVIHGIRRARVSDDRFIEIPYE